MQDESAKQSIVKNCHMESTIVANIKEWEKNELRRENSLIWWMVLTQTSQSLFSSIKFLVEIVLLGWGIRLCIVVRKAPSEFNESRFISMAIYNEFLLTIFLNVSMSVVAYFYFWEVHSINSDLSIAGCFSNHQPILIWCTLSCFLIPNWQPHYFLSSFLEVK